MPTESALLSHRLEDKFTPDISGGDTEDGVKLPAPWVMTQFPPSIAHQKPVQAMRFQGSLDTPRRNRKPSVAVTASPRCMAITTDCLIGRGLGAVASETAAPSCAGAHTTASHGLSPRCLLQPSCRTPGITDSKLACLCSDACFITLKLCLNLSFLT